MNKAARYIVVIFMCLFCLPLLARENREQNDYKQAIAFETAGEYAKAESLFVDLFTADPNNFNYYTRYRNILIQQRKYYDLQPVLEKRLDERSYDNYLKLELGLLYFTLNEMSKAKDIWTEAFKGQKGSQRNSYAAAIYRDALEYRMGNEFHKITTLLRSITGDPALLVNYNFAVAVQYRNWDPAVEEIRHILETDVSGLRYVRQYIFRYDPLSALYPRAIHSLEKTDSPEGRVLLSDIYIHLQDYEKAFEILNNGLNNEQILNALKDFAGRMFKQGQYELAVKAADMAEIRFSNTDRQSMALLSAQAEQQLFYESSKQEDIISYPFDSDFLRIGFLPFDHEQSAIIESAYEKFDSLSRLPGLPGEIASMQHAEIAYRVFQDFDSALREYSNLATETIIHDKSALIAKLCKVLLAKGEYEKALTLIQTATEEYGLMVHEEDRLLSYELYVSVISGKKDSVVEHTENVLAMLPLDDPEYNDLLAFAAVVNKVMKDSLHYDAWLEAERYLLMNNTASAIDIYKSLLEQPSEAMDIYGLRYLDCLNAQRNVEAESEFWKNYYDILTGSDMGDYFMLRYAGFMEKIQKFDISYEIFEKYLLSYQESMYYEIIRQHVREHYSLGAP